MHSVDCVVVGAGIVGLAIARALAMAGHEVVIIKKADAFGTETSSRNSEVIHAGIYYDHNSLMARFCVEGKGLLYGFCKTHGVDHERCGKLIVATTDGEAEQLSSIKVCAERNGVDDLRFVDGAEAKHMEPELHCSQALLSPSTGIIDSHGYMQSLLGDSEAHGAVLALNAPVSLKG